MRPLVKPAAVQEFSSTTNASSAPVRLPSPGPLTGMFTIARIQENQGRGAPPGRTPRPDEDGGKGWIAVLAHRQADGDDDLEPATVASRRHSGLVR